MSIKFYKAHGTEVRKAVDEATGKVVAVLGNVGELVKNNLLFDSPDYDNSKFIVIRGVENPVVNEFNTMEDAKAFVRSL